MAFPQQLSFRPSCEESVVAKAQTSQYTILVELTTERERRGQKRSRQEVVGE